LKLHEVVADSILLYGSGAWVKRKNVRKMQAAKTFEKWKAEMRRCNPVINPNPGMTDMSDKLNYFVPITE
jgi:hypothetical protein